MWETVWANPSFKKILPLVFLLRLSSRMKKRLFPLQNGKGGRGRKADVSSPPFLTNSDDGSFHFFFSLPPPPFGCFSVLYALSRAGNCPPQDIF